MDNLKKKKISNDIAKLKPLVGNKYYEDIKSVCQVYHVRLIPIPQNIKGIIYFKKVINAYPMIYNYENVVVEDNYFSSCEQMNDGAMEFTSIILRDFFKK